MTVQVEQLIYEYTGNASTVSFAYPARFDKPEQVQVLLDNAIQITGYTIVGSGDMGGDVVFDVAPGNGVLVKIWRDIPLERDIEYTEGGRLPADVLDVDIDTVWMALQDLAVRGGYITNHDDLFNIGNNSHYDLDDHVNDASIHFTQAGLDHDQLLNVGTNSHAMLDAHILDTDVHYLMSAINITESQISDFGTYEEAFAKNTGFNLNLGIIAGTVVEGNDARLSDDRNPTAHTHLASDINGGQFDDARISEANVTQHEAALSLTKSQISDFGSPLEDITNESITDLADVLTSMTPIDGQVLTYDTTEGWRAETASQGVIDHTLLTNIGVSTHPQIDSHLADITEHYTQAEISITESQINDFGSYEAAFAKNTGFNLDLGTIAGTVAEGDDSRFTDARPPTAHTHTESDITDLQAYITGISAFPLEELSDVTGGQAGPGILLAHDGNGWISDVNYIVVDNGGNVPSINANGYSDTNNMAIGNNARIDNQSAFPTRNNLVIGQEANMPYGSDAIILGYATTLNNGGDGCVIIGSGAYANNQPHGAIAIGKSAFVNGVGAIAIGEGAQANDNGTGQIVIGDSVSSNGNDTTTIGGNDNELKITQGLLELRGSRAMIGLPEGTPGNEPANPPNGALIYDGSYLSYFNGTEWLQAGLLIHSHNESDILDLDKYTQSEVDDALLLKSNTGHTHNEIDIVDLDKYSTTAVDLLVNAKEDAFVKLTAFNKNFGIGALQVCEGNDARLSDARTPTAHTHTESEITDLQAYILDITGESIKDLSDVNSAMAPANGQVLTFSSVNGWESATNPVGVTDHLLLSNIGTNSHAAIDAHIIQHDHLESDITDIDKYSQSEADLLLDAKEDTITKLTAFNRNFGTGALQVCEGDDARLSDSRDPNAHTHTESEITDLQAYLLDITSENLADLSDVLTGMTPIDGQVLTYDTILGWNNETIPSGVTDHTLLSSIGVNSHDAIDTHIADTDIHYLMGAISITESQISDLGTYEDAFTKNSGFNKDFGSISGTVVEGDDARMSDSRDPNAHTHFEAEITDLDRYTQAEVDALQLLKADLVHTHTVSDITDFGNYQAKENGFDDRTESTISFVDVSRTFTIQPTGASYIVYAGGDEYVKTTIDTIVIGDIEGTWYFYFDNTTGALSSTQTWTDELISSHAFIASVYWDASANEAVFFAEERHGSSMSAVTHLYNHHTTGCRYGEGLQPADITADGSGDIDIHAQLSVGSGEIWDEDIRNIIPSQSSPASIPILHRTGATGLWRKFAGNDFIVVTTGSGRAAYNEWTGATWQQTEVSNNDFVLMHLIATNDLLDPYVLIQGQEDFTTITLAQAAAYSDINAIDLEGLAIQEWVSVATFIVGTSNNFSNAVQSAIYSTDTGGDFVDLRQGGGGAASGSGSTTQALDDLSDVTLITSATDNVLTYNGSVWVNETPDHTKILNRGTNTHAQIDTHIADATLHFTMGSISITESQISDHGTYETAFSKNTGFNKDFGSIAGSVCQGDDVRLSDDRDPTAHTHAGGDIIFELNSQSGTSYTLTLADQGKYVRMDNAAANTLTVPLNATVAFPIGSQIQIRQAGVGQTTIVATGGVTINTPETLVIRKQHSMVTLMKVGTDEFDLVGDVELV